MNYSKGIANKLTITKFEYFNFLKCHHNIRNKIIIPIIELVRSKIDRPNIRYFLNSCILIYLITFFILFRVIPSLQYIDL